MTTPPSVPGVYAEHCNAVERTMAADLWPAVNVAQRLRNAMDAISTKLDEGRVVLSAAQQEHAAKDQLRVQAWERVIAAIQEGIGIPPDTVDYAKHWARVQELMTEMNRANGEAEIARKALVKVQRAVSEGEATLQTSVAEHDEADRKRVAVWRQVISQIEGEL